MFGGVKMHSIKSEPGQKMEGKVYGVGMFGTSYLF